MLVVEAAPPPRRPRAMPSLSRGTTTKPSARVGGAEDRRPVVASGLDAARLDRDAHVVDAADRGDDLARQRAAPRGGAASSRGRPPSRAHAGPRRGRTRTGTTPGCPAAGTTSGSPRNPTPAGSPAAARRRGRRARRAPPARGAWSSWPTDEPPETRITSPRPGRERVADRLGPVGQELERAADAAVARDQRREHRPSCCPRCVRPRAGSRRQQLVAGHDDPHARAPHHATAADADRREHADVLRPQPPARAGARPSPARDVLADARRRACRARRRSRDLDAAPSRSRRTPRPSAPRRPAGSGAPVMMRTASPGRPRPANGRPGRDSPTTASASGLYVAGAEGLLAAQGVAVHRRAGEGRHVHAGAHVLREHAPGAVGERAPARPRAARHRLREEALHVLDIGARGEATHANVAHQGPAGPGRRLSRSPST